MPNIPQYAHSLIVETAHKAKAGDAAAVDFMVCHTAAVIAASDRHDLVKIFLAYNAAVEEIADRQGVDRSKQTAEMALCAKAARNADPQAMLKIRKYLLNMCMQAPHAVWLAFQGVSLKELSDRPPAGQGRLILYPQVGG